MNKKQKLILLVLVCIVASFMSFGLILEQSSEAFINRTNETDGITISAESGFYDADFMIYISTGKPAEIYYTLDGSDPSKENINAEQVGEGIFIPCDDVEKPYNLKCIAYYQDGTVSDVICRSYMVGYNIHTRYDLPVLNVFGDPYEFYNYEDGILVQGKLDEEFLQENPHIAEDVLAKTFPSYGNRYQSGRESEKLVYMTLFNADGEIITAQNCGFRVYGGYSRSKNQPSFRLFARREYDSQNDFDYAFFENQYNSDGTTIIDKHQRLIVRNSGNDNGYAFIRNELSTRLAIDAGFPDVQASRPVCVYLNGEYYGVLWLMSNFDDEYFEQTYGSYTGEMYMFEGRADELHISEEDTDANYINIANEYNEKHDYLAQCDLNDEANWIKLNEFIDIDNYLQYIAIQHYIANFDTLRNNYRVYRYYSEDNEYTEGTVFDGRFRFLLFDLDYSFGLIEEMHYQDSVYAALTADRVESTEKEHQLFANIMRREDCREKYIRYFLSIMNYYYSESYVTPILEEMHNERYKELQYAIEQGLYLNNFCALDVTSMSDVEKEIGEIYEFMDQRPNYAFYDLVRAFGAFTPYSLNIRNNSGGGIVQIDYAEVTMQEFSGIYLAEVPAVLTAKPKLGEKFAYWLVNGEEIYEPELIIEQYMIQDYVVNVECICIPDEDAGLRITAVKSKGGKDYIELTNLGQSRVNLASYTLSDSAEKNGSVLSAIWLEPSQSQIIYCKNYTGFESLGQPGVNFNVKAEETIFLYQGQELIDYVEVPEMSSDTSVFKLDINTGIFQEKLH